MLDDSLNSCFYEIVEHLFTFITKCTCNDIMVNKIQPNFEGVFFLYCGGVSFFSSNC